MSETEIFDNFHAITLGSTDPGVLHRVVKPGEVIGGSYQLKSLLGKGGMGYVFCAEHTMIKRDYALKMLAPEQISEESRRRFEIEGKAIANLDHPNIVKVYNMGVHAGDCPFYVMDLLEGKALSECIYARQKFTLKECLDIFVQTAAGLDYAHSRGIVHRDVKPSNIILVSDSHGRLRVKIVDFGIAKLLPSANLHAQSQTATGEVLGSPLYMSPEQAMGATVDQRSDIYSLGCTIFETLCGRAPFTGQNVMATLMMHQNEPVPSILEVQPEKDWPQSIDLLLTKMMAKRAENRYQSMEEVIHDLERLSQGKAIGRTVANPASGSVNYTDGSPPGQEELEADQEPSIGEQKGGRLALIAGLGFVLVLAAGACAAWVWSAGHAGRPEPQVKAPSPKASLGPIGPSFEQSQDIYRHCHPIKSEIVLMPDGSQKRKFVFPEMSIGYVFVDGGPHVEAVGLEYLPAGPDLTLEIGHWASHEVFNFPEVVDQIDPGEFVRLEIEGRGTSGPQVQSLILAQETEGIFHILKAASSWSRLRIIQLRDCVVNKEDLAPVNDCKSLAHFIVDHASLDTEELAKEPFLLRLNCLELGQASKLGPVCRKLASSQVLESLRLWGCHTAPSDLEEFRKSKSLHLLDLQERNFAPLVQVVPKLASLREVRFRETLLNSAQIKVITDCPNVRSLWLRRKLYSDVDRAHYKLSDPKVSFED